MSPVERSNRHAGRALLVAGVGVGAALALAFLFAVLASRGSVDVRLGDDTFTAPADDDVAAEIAENGPILYPDPATFDRPIFIQHVGDDSDEGWLAFGATDPNDPSCLVTWEHDRKVFVNQCDPTTTYPADGTGLRQYTTRLTDGRLVVDLQDLERQADELDDTDGG